MACRTDPAGSRLRSTVTVVLLAPAATAAGTQMSTYGLSGGAVRSTASCRRRARSRPRARSAGGGFHPGPTWRTTAHGVGQYPGVGFGGGTTAGRAAARGGVGHVLLCGPSSADAPRSTTSRRRAGRTGRHRAIGRGFPTSRRRTAPSPSSGTRTSWRWPPPGMWSAGRTTAATRTPSARSSPCGTTRRDRRQTAGPAPGPFRAASC